MSGPLLEVPKANYSTLSPRRSTRKARSSIGASPITGMMQDRYNLLLNEFTQIDKDGNNELTFKEIHDFLSAKQGSPFDENLCKEIFKKMDKDNDNIITLDEFLWSFVEAEDLLQASIKDIKKTIFDNFKRMEEYQKKMIQARTGESFNRYGIMKGSVLTVDIIEAKDLIPMDSNGLSDPYVIIECENQRFQSKYIPETLNPVWNEEFVINVESGLGDLKITVMDRDTLMPDDYEGEVSIPLSSLRDQMKNDKYYPLSRNGEYSGKNGKIHLSLQWIWSKTKYLEDIIKQWKEVLDSDQKELVSLEDQLAQLKKPFGHLEIKMTIKFWY